MFNSMNYQSKFRATGRTSSEDTGERTSKKRKLPAAESTAKKGESSCSSGGLPGQSNAGEGPVSRKGKEKEKEALPKIRDNESLADYNRRIESLLRPGVAKAIKSANTVRSQQERNAKEAKKLRKKGVADPASVEQTDGETDGTQKRRSGVHDVSDPAKEFKTTERRRLNDIVQAPPILPHLKKGLGPGGKKKVGGGETSAWKATGRMPLNLGQERLLNAERERVVKAYREIKAEREQKRAAARLAESQAA